MERQAQLLESFAEIPSISAAWGQDLPDGGLSLTVGISTLTRSAMHLCCCLLLQFDLLVLQHQYVSMKCRA